MPPATRFSRDLYCNAIIDANGRLYLTEREPFRYVDRDDNVEHIVTAGDTLNSLAARFYPGLPEPDMLAFVIADFQPGGGIFDPTIRLAPGSRIYIPSQRTLEEDVFSESRRSATKA